ncbi:protein FAR1-RELATED SEQUENCE 5-like [Helianthus annuus]|uniref:protein FAR1-RELATED SEQUENCE 5-like n=1 Tax=Helianthus annuus TaxID=4232 RepID=UPI000B8F03B3|nr:protein FAR1-RELATED SEQUENCE 5-like [Helianthus annuus]
MASNAIVDCGDDGPSYQPRGVEHVSPSSGKKTYTPNSPPSMTPVVGMVFDTVDAAYIFYKAYAQTGGWTVRKGTEHTNHGVTVNKYFVCSKEGHKVFKPVDTLSDQPPKRWVRRVPSKRTGCQAEFRIKLNDDKKYVLYYFTEAHNHAFVHEEDLHFLRENRSLTRSHEDMIKKMSNLNIGPVRAFNIMKELCGGFDNVGATKCDFKNFKKELNVFIGEFDAEMLVKRLTRKKEFLPNFTCEYQTTEEGVLKCLFWADEDMKRNFYMFGDVVSLMPRTSETSKYNMMFVPFTGIDNHNRNVTLGASIIGPETAETYSWLLNVCKDAFGYAPRVIVTDQDPAMKRAIEDVWPDSRHRLCMWHIMDKLTTKVGPTICANTDFRKRLSAIVWTDSLLPEAFETEWAASWIPAYYREEEMSGLMRTSSRSESENHFFGKICNPKCTLVEFLSHFDTAVEAQRHEHRKNDHDTRYSSPDIWNPDFVLEKQASETYTRTIFFDVQLEIQHGIHRCASVRLEHIADFIKFYVKDLDQPTTAFYEVMIREEDVTVKCSCNRFEQFGLLCSHVFCVLRILDVREFPRQYILRRWTREAVPNSSPGSIFTDGGDPDRSVEVNQCIREISNVTEYVINKLVSKFDEMCNFRDHIKQFMSVADDAQFDAPPKSRRNRLAELLGVAPTETATIRVPIGTRFKGCGSHKRMKSKKEQAISQAGKKRRRCSKCKKFGHNNRTCGKYNVKEKDASTSKKADVGAEDVEDTDGDAGTSSDDGDDVFYTSETAEDADDEQMLE